MVFQSAHYKRQQDEDGTVSEHEQDQIVQPSVSSNSAMYFKTYDFRIW